MTLGRGKTLWMIFVILLPFLGVFIYLLTNNDGMTERNSRASKPSRRSSDQYVREVAGSGGPPARSRRRRALLDSGAITQAEFDAIKQKALASS